MDERDRDHLAPPAGHFLVADDFFHRPVATFDQHVGAALEYASDGGIFVEPSDQRNAFQRKMCIRDRPTSAASAA